MERATDDTSPQSTSAEQRATIMRLGDGVTEEVWNQGRIERLGKFYTDDVVRHVPEVPEPIVGLEANKEYIRQNRAAFPDLRIRMERTVIEGDWGAVMWSWTGTNTGDLPGGIPATGKAVRATGMSMVRLRDGKFGEIWDVSDQLALAQQLGFMPEPPAKG